MKLVVGLGNPGRKYRETRHNVGFDVLAQVARNRSVGAVTQRFQGEVVDFAAGEHRVVALCPTTFMNRSGQSVRQAFDFYKLSLSDILVVCDDFNLPLGRLRFRPHGSAGGQKGLADIIRQLGSDQVARLRVGIGTPPPRWEVADYVLSRFEKVEKPLIEDAIQRAAQGVEAWVEHGIDYCMNQYNSAVGN